MRFDRLNNKHFAEEATNNGVFGSAQLSDNGTGVITSDYNVIASLAAFKQGWNSATLTTKRLPPLEEMQGLQSYFSYLINYLYQEGQPLWNSQQAYYKGSFCKTLDSGGKPTLWYSLVDNNVGNDPTDSENKWEEASFGGGNSRNIGEIVESTVPLVDAGLHLADGALISGSGSYADFVDYMAGLVSTNPEIFASGYESETSVGSAISGGDYSTQPAVNAFDGSLSTIWGSSQLGPTNVVGHAYIGRSGLTKPVKKIRFNQGYSGSVVNYCTQLLFQYSNDGTTWVDITSVTNGANITWQEWVLPDYTPSGSTHSFRVLAYGGFTGSSGNNWIVRDIELYYWSANSEAIWQSSVSTYGVCGKYVYDSVNNTIRLPKLEGFIEGTLDPTKLGDLTEAGLPNITGTLYTDVWPSTATSGAFKRSNYSGAYRGTQTAVANIAGEVDFDASSSNPIYGNSSTVQPQSIKIYYYIVIATSTKTDIQVDIDEIATDLNGKADIDASNFNATGKETILGWGRPDYTAAVDYTSSWGSAITTQKHGWLWVRGNTDGNHTPVYFSIGTVTFNVMENGATTTGSGSGGFFRIPPTQFQVTGGNGYARQLLFFPCRGV